MCLGVLRQWWHLPVVSGLILDTVGHLYGQLLVRHNEVYLLLRVQEKHILFAKAHNDWKCLLITYDEDGTEEGIPVMPVWKWLVKV